MTWMVGSKEVDKGAMQICLAHASSLFLATEMLEGVKMEEGLATMPGMMATMGLPSSSAIKALVSLTTLRKRSVESIDGWPKLT